MTARGEILAALERHGEMSIPDLRARVDDVTRGAFGAALSELVDLREIEVDVSADPVTVRRPGE